MNHKEAMDILRNYYSHELKKIQERIDNEGALPKEVVHGVQENIKQWEQTIEADADDFVEMLGATYQDNNPIADDLQKVMEHNNLDFKRDSKEYELLKKCYKHVKHNYLKDALKYNQSVTEFSLLEGSAKTTVKQQDATPHHKLSDVIDAYLAEKSKEGITQRTLDDIKVKLEFLTDCLGSDYSIEKVDNSKARQVKSYLMNTPKGRNKDSSTKDLPLLEQISTAKEKGLECIGNKTANGYLGNFKSLFDWAKDNRYVDENVFEGLKIKQEKKKLARREAFTTNEIETIKSNLDDAKLVKNKSNYWGALIALYTGARRNEVAGLLPSDIKYSEEHSIHYFDINEEDKSKSLKSEAAKRIVPVHPKLIELGFLDFVEESKKVGSKKKLKDGNTPRLLYHLTFLEHEKWGRKLGRWFNEGYLVKLGLKTKKKVLHSLRHSFITNLSAASVDNAIIKSIVGHEADTVTSQVYTHYGIEHLPAFKQAIEKLPY